MRGDDGRHHIGPENQQQAPLVCLDDCGKEHCREGKEQ
jgi:hypothetical protein